MVYSLNPSYMFFDTQYGYESLGIALSFLTIVSCIKLRQGQGKASKASEKRWLITGCASACACAATHHLSSMFAVIVCVLVCLLMPLRTNLNAEQRIRLARSSWTVTLVSVAVTILWIGVFAEGTVGYIWPHISAGADQLLNLFSSKSKTDGGATFGGSNLSGSHSLFSGSEAPSYEQLAALLAPAIILVFSWLGFAALWKKRKVSSRYAIQLPMIILTATYFVSLPLALTNGGGEGAHRSWAYTYLGVALLVVMGATSSPSLTLPKILRRFVRSSGEESGRGMHARRRVAWRKRYIASMGLAVLFMIVAVGNVAAGENVDYRFPGPYRPASDTRSVTAELRQVASWANSHIRPGTKVMTDRYTSEIIEGYTDLNVPTPNDYSVYDIYLDGGVGTSLLRSSIKSDGFSYFILDNRIETESLLTKLFSIYGLKVTQAPSAFPSSGNNGFLSLVFRTPHYRIYKIDN